MSFELDILSYTLLGSIFGAAALLSIRNARGPDIHPLLLNTQSDVSRVRYPGSSAVYRSRMYPNGSPLLSTSDRSIRTLRDWYLTAFGKFKGKTFICDRTPGAYAWHNYETIEMKAKAYFSGLVNVSGLEPLSGRESSFVGIFSPNTADTLAIEIGCHCGGLVTVPISQDTTPSHLSHVLENSGLKVLVIHSALLNRLTAMASNFNLHVPHIIVIGGGVAAGELSKLESLGVKIHQLPDIERNGTENPVAFGEPQNNNIASIYYTSSSPSNGKHGVILTHKNLLSVAASYALIIPPAQRLTPKDRLMHNLPIDDVYGHILTLLSCACGSSLVYAENVGEKIDTPTALSNAAEAKPTILASGSTFLEQVKDLIETRYGNSFLFRRGLDKKKAYFEEGRLVTDSKYDMLVFRDIRQKLFGGNLRLVLIDYNGKYDHKSGLASFLRAVLGTQVLQTFNRPETASSVSLSMFFDYRADPAAVGAPLPCNEIKLEDLPDRGYTAEDKPNPRGEICVRGNNVFAGYWNDDLATERVKDADGWYMTSIIGEILPNGTLKILGPK